jgi:hypothetical protein
MYDMVFGGAGQDVRAVLLSVLGLTTADVGRYRDAWVERSEKGEPRITIYTRNGSGNRDDWSEHEPAKPGEYTGANGCSACACDRLPNHPNYLSDEDDDFDGTYARFYFSFPTSPPPTVNAEFVKQLEEIAKSNDPVDTSQRWLDAIDKLKGTAND